MAVTASALQSTYELGLPTSSIMRRLMTDAIRIMNYMPQNHIEIDIRFECLLFKALGGVLHVIDSQVVSIGYTT